jgi:hypothetical protein
MSENLHPRTIKYFKQVHRIVPTTIEHLAATHTAQNSNELDGAVSMSS